MPANYVLIGEYTTNTSVASVTFSNIPQTSYTDLKIVCSSRDDRSGQPNGDLTLQVGYNGTINTGSIYTMRRVGGNGSSTFSDSTATTSLPFGMSTSTTATANTYGNSEFYIPNYASSISISIYADGVSENNATTAFSVLNAGLISTNNPITDIKIFPFLASNFVANSTFSLYGIAAFGTTPTILPKATGGDIVVNDGTYWYHAFLSSGIFTPLSNFNADVLQVAGGGGGGNYYSCGGGGAGGLLGFTNQSLVAATNYPATIGAGGASSGGLAGTNGGNSQFGSLTTSVGGGGGAVRPNNGIAGGSGGGGSGYSANTTGGAASPSGQGNPGANGTVNGTSPQDYAGGGGGAGGAGVSGVGLGYSNGGIGSATYSSWGLATVTGDNRSGTVYYAGGGGGYSNNGGGIPQAVGGFGGGGAGNKAQGPAATAGTVNTGGGGGGGWDTSPNDGRAGGSGIIIVRYTMA